MASTAKILSVIAIIQGLAVLALKRSIEAESWLVTIPSLHVALWTMVLTIPLLSYLLLDSHNWRRSIKPIGFSGLVFGLLGAYTGYEMGPYKAFPVDSILIIYIICIFLLSFKVSVFCRTRWLNGTNDYSMLLKFSWRHAFLGAGSLLFTGVLWLVLALWAGIFNIIGIDFFEKLFYKDWFALPVTTVSLASGILIFRQIDTLIDTLTRFFRVLLQYLLPLLAAVSAMFLLSLPFTGMSSLWGNGFGTSLVLWMNALLLFFCNAVFQGDSAPIYPSWLRKLLAIMLLSLPILSLLGAYGMWLRIDQHGWTIARFWGVITTLFLLLFSLGYGLLISRYRVTWTQHLGRVNVPMAWILCSVLVTVNSPLINPRALALESQLSRAAPSDQLKNTDWKYIHRHLGRVGDQTIDTVLSNNPQLTRDELLQLNGENNLLVSERIVLLGGLPELPTNLVTALNAHFQPSAMRLFVAKVASTPDNPERFLAANESGYNWTEIVLMIPTDKGDYIVEPLEKTCAMTEERLIKLLEVSEIESDVEQREIIRVGELILQRQHNVNSSCSNTDDLAE
ncbi:uncharacterized protein DUF4153 [Umboniibacter marinipuniceus]|uniref:Uncharacterized protein DUF4153 n=2 Tax=Umboniibacter marinipuniceus TaxID=569599 RepID=A0A3M0ABN0_9GAMM|nr:uncharacterized protein DUF4153 [Umboniibacter marinipuniceus]